MYSQISPYAYVANNPLLYIDPDGMRLVLTFESQEAMNLYTTTVNNQFEGEFEVKYTAIEGSDNQYEANVVAVEGQGNTDQLSENGQAFYSSFTEVTKNSDYTADMTITLDDPDTDIGNYKTNTMDIGDISALPITDLCGTEQCGPTQSGKIIHETREQFGKGVDGYGRGDDRGYGGNHGPAQDAEDIVNGNTRGRDGWGGSDGARQTFTSKKYGRTNWSFKYGRKKGERTKVKRVN